METPKNPSEKKLALLIGRRLKFFRERIKLTQSDLAHAIGVGQSMISQAESGAKLMALHNLYTAAKIFGVPISALLSDDDMTTDELNAFFNLGKIIKKKKSKHRSAVLSHINSAAEDPTDK